MKRLLIASLSALTFAAPLAATDAAAHDHGRGRGHHDRYDRDYDNWDDRRDERRAYREGYRDRRSYDHYRHNGYYLGRSWYYGPPPSAYYARHDYYPGYRAWRRGDYLPPYYRARCHPVDYRDYRLAPPPYGAHWVRDDRGDFLLVGVATGLILGLALAH